MANWNIGLIINPIAGMGGKVGLKGSDGDQILEQAKELGAIPQANARAELFLTPLIPFKDQIVIHTVSGIMGGNISQKLGFNFHLINSRYFSHSTELYHTSSDDTKQAVKLLKEIPVDLLCFVGGDGTARDIYSSEASDIGCLGIPGGVKIHSSVFATNPKAAAELVIQFFSGKAALRDAEVMDINEDAFRDNRVESQLYGYLKTPYSPQFIQPSKMASPHTEEESSNQERIARYIIDQMEKDSNEYAYLLGPGTTTRTITTLLNQPKTLLGVDLVQNKQIVAMDLNEQQILSSIANKKVKLVVTPIGRQGFVFGRGNLQLSAEVLFQIGLKNILIIATKFKMTTLPNGKLRIDSRDQKFDKKFSGLHRIIVDYGELIIGDVENVAY